MRGYFGIGAEGIHKPQNVGALARTAHAFGASFFFTLSPSCNVHEIRQTDTSGAFDHMPYYQYETLAEMQFPMHCQLVGVELVEDSIPLPSFMHPMRAAYILGPEKGSLSPQTLERCDFVVQIPTKFCLNVGLAGALTMYDRQIALGKNAERPVKPSLVVGKDKRVE